MNINSISDFRTALRSGPYAWPGGYPLFFLMSDGGALSFAAARDNTRQMLEALRDHDNSGWRPVALAINWEDPSLYCDHTGARIESAYAEDEAAE